MNEIREMYKWRVANDRELDALMEGMTAQQRADARVYLLSYLAARSTPQVVADACRAAREFLDRAALR